MAWVNAVRPVYACRGQTARFFSFAVRGWAHGPQTDDVFCNPSRGFQRDSIPLAGVRGRRPRALLRGFAGIGYQRRVLHAGHGVDLVE